MAETVTKLLVVVEDDPIASFNGHTLAMLKYSICHMDKLYDVVKCLLLKLFPDAYILSHSVSGMAANSKTGKKPAFGSRLYSAFVTMVKEKFPSASSKEITEKVHSVPKNLKNEEKKI